jgi:putative transcriptional regulator
VNPRHHPSADVLASYAAGTLEPGFGLVVGAHVEMCAACRQRVAAFEAASGEALRDLPQADVGAVALSSVLARLNETPPAQTLCESGCRWGGASGLRRVSGSRR